MRKTYPPFIPLPNKPPPIPRDYPQMVYSLYPWIKMVKVRGWLQIYLSNWRVWLRPFDSRILDQGRDVEMGGPSLGWEMYRDKPISVLFHIMNNITFLIKPTKSFQTSQPPFIDDRLCHSFTEMFPFQSSRTLFYLIDFYLEMCKHQRVSIQELLFCSWSQTYVLHLSYNYSFYNFYSFNIQGSVQARTVHIE